MRRLCRLLFLVFVSCSDVETQSKAEHTQQLPEANAYPLDIDMSANATDFIANCQTCHTARYIEMQPDFPRKTWAKIVDKMVHAYGAPIDSATAIRIVDYLVWVQDR